jgi:uncharacterized protein (DUF302 family)
MSTQQQAPASLRSDGAIVTKLSPRPVADTVARLSSVLAEKGLKLFALIDHSGEAEAVGLRLRETKVVVFGSPQAGTPVMDAAPLAALDLPLKVLIWADGEQTKVCTRRRPSWPHATGSATSSPRGSPASTPSPTLRSTADRRGDGDRAGVRRRWSLPRRPSEPGR